MRLVQKDTLGGSADGWRRIRFFYHKRVFGGSNTATIWFGLVWFGLVWFGLVWFFETNILTVHFW